MQLTLFSYWKTTPMHTSFISFIFRHVHLFSKSARSDLRTCKLSFRRHQLQLRVNVLISNLSPTNKYIIDISLRGAENRNFFYDSRYNSSLILLAAARNTQVLLHSPAPPFVSFRPEKRLVLLLNRTHFDE